jgi:hypothetical protein
MSSKPVVLYGASGYTGRLIAEFLREYQIPFIAAGRNPEAVQAAMDKVPGIETADYEVVKVDHTLEALTELLTGAKVLCNTVGPFKRFGEVVMQAALNADCHYLDTGGEQQFMVEMEEKYSAAFAAKGLVLAPSVAYMYSVLEIAAEYCLEEPGIDTLNAVCIPTGVPTVGSTRTVMELARARQTWLTDRKLVEIENANQLGTEVVVPGFNNSVLTLPWGGGCLPLWYKNDSRVRNVVSTTGFTNRQLMEGVIEMSKFYNENLKDLPNDQQEAELNTIAAGFTPGMPPRENRNVHRTVDRVQGTGNNKQVSCTLVGNCAYLQTGLIQAFVADRLVHGKPLAVGLQGASKIVGHRELHAALQGYGFLANVKIEKLV